MGLLEAALARPFQTFGGEDLYPTILQKAAALDALYQFIMKISTGALSFDEIVAWLSANTAAGNR